MTSWVLASLANHVWQSTLFVAFVWLVTLGLRRHDARVRYWLWAAASVKFLLPFSWLISLGALVEWRTASTIAQPAATFVMQEILASPLFSGDVPQVPQDTNIAQWVVLGVWLAGTAVVICWWGRQWRPLRLALRRATPRRLGRDSDAGELTVMSSPSAFEPAVVGILRPVLLLPEGLLERLTRPQLDAILEHERAHVRAHDNLFAIVHMAVAAIFWFHPLVWWIERRMIDERERACDEAVVRAGKQPADYAEGILAVCRWSHESPVMCVSGVTGSDLRIRIERIMANRLGRRLHLTGRLLLAGAALIVLAGPVGIGLLVAAAQEPHAQAPAQAPAAAQAPAMPSVTFDVASIRRNQQAEAARASIPPNVTVYAARSQTLPGGRFLGRGMSARELIRDAYGYRNRPQSDLVGAPRWIDDERYDVEAKASVDFPPSTSVGLPPAGQAALRALLAERFNLRVRVEMQRRPVYELVMQRADGRLGPNLVPSKGGCVSFFEREPVNVGMVIAKPSADEPAPLPPCGTAASAGAILAQNMTLSDFVRILQVRPQINRTVIDRTGLTGRFDITIRADSGASAAGLLPPLQPWIESQLGLTLRDAEAPVEILVIEHIDRPTEN